MTTDRNDSWIEEDALLIAQLRNRALRRALVARYFGASDECTRQRIVASLLDMALNLSKQNETSKK